MAPEKSRCIANRFWHSTCQAALPKPCWFALHDTVISCTPVARSLDLKAGQLVDRVGGMLGLPFPAGPLLDNLSQQSTLPHRLPKPSVNGADCHLSGVENQCRRMLEQGASREDVARFCLLSIEAAIAHMTERLLQEHGDLPVVYAGGVMSNTQLRQSLTERFDGVFASAEYSSDNAVGIAVLTTLMCGGEFA